MVSRITSSGWPYAGNSYGATRLLTTPDRSRKTHDPHNYRKSDDGDLYPPRTTTLSRRWICGRSCRCPGRRRPSSTNRGQCCARRRGLSTGPDRRHLHRHVHRERGAQFTGVQPNFTRRAAENQQHPVHGRKLGPVHWSGGRTAGPGPSANSALVGQLEPVTQPIAKAGAHVCGPGFLHRHGPGDLSEIRQIPIGIHRLPAGRLEKAAQ